MSQAGVVSTSVSPPDVPTQFTADDSTIGIPVGNNLNLVSRISFDDDDDFIRTTADPNGSENFLIEVTNRFVDTLTTTDATTTPLNTFSFNMQGTYQIETYIVAYNVTDNIGACYRVFAGILTDGVAVATKISTEDKIVNEQSGMENCEVTVSTSGNDVLIQVTGLAGKTINWKSNGSYISVGA
jgi:hypothetical protein